MYKKYIKLKEEIMKKGQCQCGKKIDKYINQSNSMRADGCIYVYEGENPKSCNFAI